MQIKDFFKNSLLDERLNCVVENLVGMFHPKRIYIYGSFAKGKIDLENDLDMNDIDLLVIVNKSDLRFTERIIEMKKICSGEPHVSPIMYTETELAEMVEEGEGYIEDILDEAILLYRKPKKKSPPTMI